MTAGGGRFWPVLQSLVTAGVRGRSTREPRGVDSPAHLGCWRPVGGSPRRRAELNDYGGGGGAGSSEGRGTGAAWLGMVVVELGGAPRPLL